MDCAQPPPSPPHKSRCPRTNAGTRHTTGPPSHCKANGANQLCTRSHNNALLCATSVFSVSLWLMNSEQKHTTETQRTQRLHREFSGQEPIVQSRANHVNPVHPAQGF